MRYLLSTLAAFALVFAAPGAFAKSRIKDIVEFEGVRTNSLVGYGVFLLVLGAGFLARRRVR